MNKDVRKLARKAREQGWRVRTTGRGHHQFFSPDGKTIVPFGEHLGDWRAYKNSLAALRRAGLKLE